MNVDFIKLQKVGDALEKNAAAHAWSACLPLTAELESLLKHLPPPQNDEERGVLTQVFERFKTMNESATAEHADVAKLLQKLAQVQRRK